MISPGISLRLPRKRVCVVDLEILKSLLATKLTIMTLRAIANTLTFSKVSSLLQGGEDS